MATSPSPSRFTGILGFFIGIFGAMAILGVFFKIIKFPNYEVFMVIGFMGEAAAFVTMGLLELGSAFKKKEKPAETAEDVQADSSQIQPGEQQAVTYETEEVFRKMLEEQISTELNHVMFGLSEQVRFLGEEIHEVAGELERTRHSIQTMRTELDRVSSGDLADSAEMMGQGMAKLGNEMGEAGQHVEEMRSELEKMVDRFHHFNKPRALAPDRPSNGVTERIKNKKPVIK